MPSWKSTAASRLCLGAEPAPVRGVQPGSGKLLRVTAVSACTPAGQPVRRRSCRPASGNLCSGCRIGTRHTHERLTRLAFSSKKIGVLTFHRCINYGSYWQARRLVEGLRACGHKVVLLDHHCPAVNKLEWRCALDPALPDHTPRSDLQHYAAKPRSFLKAIEAPPLSPRFKLGFPLRNGGL
jgi:hypothetical protein